MKRTFYWSLSFILLAGTAFGSIKTDYNHLTNFGRYQSFAWKGMQRAPGDSTNRSLLRSRVESAVDEQLVRKGMHESASAPDVYLTYRFRAREVADPMWGPGFSRWPWHGMDPAADVYTQGTLFIDMIDAKTGQVVWTAYCQDTGSDPLDVRSAKLIDKLIAGAFKHFPPKNSHES